MLAVSTRPNPAWGRNEIRYAIPGTARGSLAIYDVQGRMVRALLAGRIDAGVHVTHWDGRASGGQLAPGGVYFARLVIDGRETTSRFVLLR